MKTLPYFATLPGSLLTNFHPAGGTIFRGYTPLFPGLLEKMVIFSRYHLIKSSILDSCQSKKSTTLF